MISSTCDTNIIGHVKIQNKNITKGKTIEKHKYKYTISIKWMIKVGDVVKKSVISLVNALLPPPLSAIPAKFHTPLSLYVHSLSTGIISATLSSMIFEGDEELEVLSGVLGVTHDIHQKLVKDGLSSPKTAKKYIRDALETVDLSDYYKYVERGIDSDACGKNNPILGVTKEVSTICHMGDMVQGRYTGLQLLYWLKSMIDSITNEIDVGLYSVMIPQPFARTKIMSEVYRKLTEKIMDKKLVLTSPWGLYVFTYSDVLPESVMVYWDELTFCEDITDDSVLKCDDENDKDKKDSKNDKEKSKVCGLYVCKSKRGKYEKVKPVLDKSILGSFINVKLGGVDYKNITSDYHYCGLTGTRHLKDQSLPLMYYKYMSNLNVKIEKWNRFLASNTVVRHKGNYSSGVGIGPLCGLDATSTRGILNSDTTVSGFVSLSISKPIPSTLLDSIHGFMNDMIVNYKSKSRGDFVYSETRRKISGRINTIVDKATATIFLPLGQSITTKSLLGGLLYKTYHLLKYGFYPIKILPVLNNDIPDRILVTPQHFKIIDISPTSKRESKYIPWVISILKILPQLDKDDALDYLSLHPKFSPLLLLSVSGGRREYDHVFSLLSKISPHGGE